MRFVIIFGKDHQRHAIANLKKIQLAELEQMSMRCVDLER
jgi:hypothetical protein